MSTSARALRFDEGSLWVDLVDGRVLGVPLAWFPRLLRATPEQRARGDEGRGKRLALGRAGRGHLCGRPARRTPRPHGEAADGGVIGCRTASEEREVGRSVSFRAAAMAGSER